jgi:hypothetical protein
MITIFYSWQSDSPSSSNRSFIKDALEKAIKALKKGSEEKGSEAIKIEMRVDTATDNLPGSPDISASIFEKISNSQIFIGDVTIINPSSRVDNLIRLLTRSSSSTRLMPNPNVLIELGFAAHCLGWDQVICVVNTAQNRVEDLPFDIRARRMCTYSYPNNQKTKEEIKKQLISTLRYALIEVITNINNINDLGFINVNVILAKKFCDCLNCMGVVLTYFLANDLGYEKSEKVVNGTICTVTEKYNKSAIDTIISIFEKKNLMEVSNAQSDSGEKLSWYEWFIVALERVYKECETLLLKYGSSGNPNLIYSLERVKDISRTMIDLTNNNISSYIRETYSDETRQKVYANSLLKPYLLEIISVRILAIQYLSFSPRV